MCHFPSTFWTIKDSRISLAYAILVEIEEKLRVELVCARAHEFRDLLEPSGLVVKYENGILGQISHNFVLVWRQRTVVYGG